MGFEENNPEIGSNYDSVEYGDNNATAKFPLVYFSLTHLPHLVTHRLVSLKGDILLTAQSSSSTGCVIERVIDTWLIHPKIHLTFRSHSQSLRYVSPTEKDDIV